MNDDPKQRVVSQTDYPPRFEVLPEGGAALFLKSVGLNPVKDDVDRLTKIFKLYYQQGRKDALVD